MENSIGRICNVCHEFKLREFFHFEKRSPDKMRRTCKACRVEIDRKRRETDPEWVEKRRQYHADRYRRKSANEPSFVAYMKGRRATPRGRTNQLIYHAKKRAQARGWEFTITHERVEKALEKGVCEITGLPFDLNPNKGGHFNPYGPSLDRKDKNKGYTDENVQIVYWAYNVGKGEMSDDDYKAFVLHLADAIMREV